MHKLKFWYIDDHRPEQLDVLSWKYNSIVGWLTVVVTEGRIVLRGIEKVVEID